jgi:hypothetical protein
MCALKVFLKHLETCYVFEETKNISTVTEAIQIMD